MNTDYSFLLDETLTAVRAAGEIILEHHRRPRRVRYKGRIDLVTETDLAVEDFLKRELTRICPEALFMGEESYTGGGLLEAGEGPVWIVDPVDGTTNFAHRLPFVAVSAALWQGGRSALGVVNAPILGECFWALRGKGAYLNGAPLRVSGQIELEKALVATGFPYSVARDLEPLTARFRRVLQAAQGVRRCGAAAIDLAYLADGRYDAFYENGLKAWDVAAGILLVEEAGGLVSRYDGGPFTPGDDEILASAGPKLHAAMRERLKI